MSRKPDPISIASGIVDVALQAGADASDVYVRTASEFSIQVRSGEVESLKRSSTMGLGLRVTVDGRTAMVHTTDLGQITLMNLAKRALAMARTLPDPEEPTLYAEPHEVVPMPMPDPLIAEEDQSVKIGRAVEVERAMIGVPGVTNSSGTSYDESTGLIALVNSKGVSLESRFCHIDLGGEAIAERDGESATGGRHVDVPSRKYLPPTEEIGRTAGERAVSLLGSRPLPSTKAPVIFDRRTGWALLRYLVPPLAGDNVAHGRSYLADAIGERIAAEGVTIRDNAWLHQGPGRRAFDGEGTPTQNLVVVEDGVLKSYFTDLLSAKRLGLAPTGSAGRDGYASRPSIGTSNFYLEPGTKTREQIIGATKRGLLLANLSGWWVGLSPFNETFSSAAMGFWIEDGEIAYPVRSISVGGTTLEMLKAIDMIGNDLEFVGETSAPTFRVAEMAISGV